MKKNLFIGIVVIFLILTSIFFIQKDSRKPNEEEIEITFQEDLETELIRIANNTEGIKILKQNKNLNIETGIEEFSEYYRVFYKDKDIGIYLYGVDIDKKNMEVIESGFLD
jgi:regulatory protein YycI of two-component signal transduction system YycFG